MIQCKVPTVTLAWTGKLVGQLDRKRGAPWTFVYQLDREGPPQALTMRYGANVRQWIIPEMCNMERFGSGLHG